MLTAESDKKLFLLDAYALIFRAYYAFIRNPRINSKGQNTSAVFGFTTTVLDVLKNERPTHLAVVFDPPGPTFRHEEYTEYKANRDETPEDIRRRLARARAEMPAGPDVVVVDNGGALTRALGQVSGEAEKA